jgi:hypothetical protein
MRRIVLCVILGVLFAVSAHPQTDGSGPDMVSVDLGHAPAGDVVDLPAWAFGNLTVTGFNPQRPMLDVTVNVIPELLPGPSETYSIEPGEIVTVILKTGTRLVFYYKAKTVRVDVREDQSDGTTRTYQVDRYTITLVVRKLPPAS